MSQPPEVLEHHLCRLVQSLCPHLAAFQHLGDLLLPRSAYTAIAKHGLLDTDCAHLAPCPPASRYRLKRSEPPLRRTHPSKRGTAAIPPPTTQPNAKGLFDQVCDHMPASPGARLISPQSLTKLAVVAQPANRSRRDCQHALLRGYDVQCQRHRSVDASRADHFRQTGQSVFQASHRPP